MKRKNNFKPTSINCNESFIGETLMIELRVLTKSNQPIQASSPMIYTAKADGVQPQYDIRTDRWEIAENMMGQWNKSEIAKGQSYANIMDMNQEAGAETA